MSDAIDDLLEALVIVDAITPLPEGFVSRQGWTRLRRLLALDDWSPKQQSVVSNFTSEIRIYVDEDLPDSVMEFRYPDDTVVKVPLGEGDAQ